MHAAAKLIPFLACLSVLGMQVGGLHLHVDEHGYSGAAHGTHVHLRGADGHDHDGDKDVSIVPLAAPAAKVFLFFLTLGLALPALLRTAHGIARPMRALAPARRRTRWRPPLRAPPFEFR